MPTINKMEIEEKHLWMGAAGIAVVILLLYFIFKKPKGGVDPNVSSITVPTQGGSIEWSPNALIKQVHQAYAANWASNRCKVVENLMKLQDVQLRAVAEGYKRTYNQTMRSLLEGAWWACFNAPWSDDPHQQLIARMDALQIP